MHAPESLIQHTGIEDRRFSSMNASPISKAKIGGYAPLCQAVCLVGETKSPIFVGLTHIWTTSWNSCSITFGSTAYGRAVPSNLPPPTVIPWRWWTLVCTTCRPGRTFSMPRCVSTERFGRAMWRFTPARRTGSAITMKPMRPTIM